MRNLTPALALAAGLFALGAAATPALADVDFRFGIDLGPPAYYGPYYYAPYYGPHYYHPHGYYYYYR